MADSPIVHWFPGHMAKATRMITEYIKKGRRSYRVIRRAYSSF